MNQRNTAASVRARLLTRARDQRVITRIAPKLLSIPAPALQAIGIGAAIGPIIAGSLHWLDCEIHAEHAAGDHLIVIGEVKALNLQATAATQPLLYFKGQYCNLAAHHAA